MRPMTYTRSLAAAAIFAAGPAAADAVQTSACQRDLAVSIQLIEAIHGRERQFARGDMTRNCQLLRQNLTDMVKAREPMDRCLIGHEKGETAAQLDASIGDIRAVL